MGVTRTDLFSSTQNEIAVMAKAFAHPARVAILQFLIQSKGCINSDLVQEVGLAQATISQHLRELRDIGIIRGTIDGLKINYCINPQRWQEIEQQFTAIFTSYQPPATNLCC
jgi:DNA-binding transcriptional ArsR family regulator